MGVSRIPMDVDVHAGLEQLASGDRTLKATANALLRWALSHDEETLAEVLSDHPAARKRGRRGSIPAEISDAIQLLRDATGAEPAQIAALNVANIQPNGEGMVVHFEHTGRARAFKAPVTDEVLAALKTLAAFGSRGESSDTEEPILVDENGERWSARRVGYAARRGQS